MKALKSLENDIIKQFVLSQSVIRTYSKAVDNEYERVLGLVNTHLMNNDIKNITELRKLIRVFTSEKFEYVEAKQMALDFAKTQSDTFQQTLKNYVTGITVAKLTKTQIERTLNSIIVNNETINKMFSTLTDQTKTYFRQELTNAFVQSQTVDEITGDILARLPTINKKIKQQSITQSRTMLNGISNGMFKATADANSETLEGYRILVILDNRTSTICQAYGSTPDKVYPLKNHPQPPFHYNCRSILLPAIKDEYDAMFDNSEVTRPVRVYDKDGKLERIERVSPTTSYDEYLRLQPKAFQKQHLGATKYKLFNNGVKLDKFVDSGRALSVGELRNKFAEFL